MPETKTLTELAHGLDFETEEEYFEYIIDSNTNGQPTQVKSLYENMDYKDRDMFIKWLDNHKDEREILKILLNR